MSLRTIILMSLLLIPVALAAQTADDARGLLIADLTAAVEAELAAGQTPGCTIALFDAEDIVWSAAFGHTDRERRVEVVERTRFSAQSTTKLLTAVALLQLAERGLVDLDASISRYLPDLRLRSVWGDAPEDRIRVRWLLDHRSGLPHEASVNNNYDLDTGTFDEHLASIGKVQLKFAPGRRQAYSNLGYALAGRILETVTGETYADYVRRNILEPLAMGRSTCDRKLIASDDMRARGHADAFDRVPEVPDVTPAGGLYTTSLDLARLIRCLLRDGETVDGRRILSAESCAELAAPPFAGQSRGHCLGMEIQTQGGIELHLAPGRGYGFVGGAVWVPSAGLGLTMLINRQDTMLPYGLMFRFLQYAAEFATPCSRPTGIGDFAGELPDPAEWLGDYIGEEGRLTLSADGDRLLLDRHDGGASVEVTLANGALRPAVAGSDTQGWFLFNEIGCDRPALVDMDSREAFMLNTAPSLGPGPDEPRWRNYEGEFHLSQWGRVVETWSFTIRDGHPFWNDLRLVEKREGLFFTPTGECLDLRGAPATYRNIALERD